MATLTINDKTYDIGKLPYASVLAKRDDQASSKYHLVLH